MDTFEKQRFAAAQLVVAGVLDRPMPEAAHEFRIASDIYPDINASDLVISSRVVDLERVRDLVDELLEEAYATYVDEAQISVSEDKADEPSIADVCAEALSPFAALASVIAADLHDDTAFGNKLTIGDLRRAARVHAMLQGRSGEVSE